jgi:hypothetical protein
LPIFTKAENLSVFTGAENLSGFPKGENLSGFPKGEILSVLPKAEDLSVFPKAEGVSDFQVWDIGQVTVSNFDWLPFTPLWSPSPVLQLVSEPVWSPVGFNRLCDLKATWRKELLSLWSSMARISVTGKTELATIF